MGAKNNFWALLNGPGIWRRYLVKYFRWTGGRLDDIKRLEGPITGQMRKSDASRWRAWRWNTNDHNRFTKGG